MAVVVKESIQFIRFFEVENLIIKIVYLVVRVEGLTVFYVLEIFGQLNGEDSNNYMFKSCILYSIKEPH